MSLFWFVDLIVHELQGLTLGAGTDKLVNVWRCVMVLIDIGTDLFAVFGFTGGDIHGHMELGTGIGAALLSRSWAI